MKPLVAAARRVSPYHVCSLNGVWPRVGLQSRQAGTQAKSMTTSARLSNHKTIVAYETLTDRIVGSDGRPLLPLPSLPGVVPKGKSPARAKEVSETKKTTKTQAADGSPKPKRAVPEKRPSRGKQGIKAPAEAVEKSHKTKATEDTAQIEVAGTQDMPATDLAGMPTPADGHKWPPLASAVLTDMSRYPDTILLTKVGGFYESYFHQAPVLASLLGIKLATRKWGGTTVPMAGFPVFQLEKYLKTLVLDKGLLVAIAEEFRAPPRADQSFSESNKNDAKRIRNETMDISRRITRVVSPGTLLDEKFLDPFVNNFIVGVSALPPKDDTDAVRFGLAWLDVSTADFNTTICSDYQTLRDEIARIAPREVVIDGAAILAFDLADEIAPGSIDNQGKVQFSTRDLVMDSSIYVSRFAPSPSPSSKSSDSPALPQGKELGDEAEIKAVKTLLAYLRTRLLDDSESLEALSITTPSHLRQESTLRLDAHTLDALEIKERGREGAVRGSLFSVLRRTVTRGGTRLLQQWLTAPSTSLTTIEGRLDLVSLFLRSRALREDVRGIMRQGAGDAGRVLQKLVTRRNDEQDLLEIRDFIATISRITVKLADAYQHRDSQLGKSSEAVAQEEKEWGALQALADKFHDLSALGAQLGDAIDERVIESRVAKQQSMAMEVEAQVLASNAPGGAAERRATAVYHSPPSRQRAETSGDNQSNSSDLWGEPFEHLIRPTSSKPLFNAVKQLTRLRQEASQLQNAYRAAHGSHVMLRHILGLGFVVHARGKPIPISSTDSDASPTTSLYLAGKKKGSSTYYSKPWTVLAHKIENTQAEIKKLEALALEDLRQQVLTEITSLRRNARLVDQLDVIVGFSQVAEEYGLVRPVVDESRDLEIVDGRHLSVEIGLLERGRLFIKNDTSMLSTVPSVDESARGGRVQLITGPNMGGKSTYLRQVAMICILAQCGCFVPAASARIGLVDAIFTRIGAQDDLFRDRSTFMVEMSEVSEILSRSTAKSLVIADEIGRGTSNLTGIAIGFSTLVDLYNRQCRTLFATHFHEIVDLVESSQTQESMQDVHFYATDVTSKTAEFGSTSIVYSHKIRPGHNRDSYGLQVAQLANLPSTALTTAAKTLDYLQAKHPKSIDYRDSHDIIFPK